MDVKYVAFEVGKDGGRRALVTPTTLPRAKAAVSYARNNFPWRTKTSFVIEAQRVVVTAAWEVDTEGGLVPVGTKEGGE